MRLRGIGFFDAARRMAAAVLVLAGGSGSVAAEDPLVFGVHPFVKESVVLSRFTPLVDHLAQSTGRSVKIRVSESYEAHIRSVGLDQLDLAYMGPLPYVRMVDGHGRKPLLAALEVEGESVYRGVVFTQAGSDIVSLADVAGRHVAFGDPNSTMSYLVPLSQFMEAGVDLNALKRYDFVGTHTNVALTVLGELFDAGAVREDVFLKYRERGLRPIAHTPPIPTHVLVARAGLSDTVVDFLRQALLGLKERSVLERLYPGATGFVEARDASFDGLRRILRKLEEKMPRPNRAQR